MNISETECLVLEGGGVRGVAFIGALQELKKAGILDQIRCVVGSSIGAVHALYIVLGIDLDVMEQFYLKTDFNDYRDISSLYVKEIFRFITKKGFDSGCKLKKWFEKLLYTETGKKDITFKELYERTNKNLVITGTNLNIRKTEYFSHKNTPDMKVADALRISISLPIYFTPCRYNGSLYVDGGYLNNYPIWYFDEEFIEGHEHKVLGLKLLSEHEEPTDDIDSRHLPVDSLKKYLLSLLNTAFAHIERSYIKPGYWERTIPIKTKNIDSTDFGIGEKEKRCLIDNGRKAVKKVLEAV